MTDFYIAAPDPRVKQLHQAYEMDCKMHGHEQDDPLVFREYVFMLVASLSRRLEEYEETGVSLD